MCTSNRIAGVFRYIAVIFAAMCFLAVAVSRAGQTRKVLVLNSYHPTYEWTKSTLQGIESALGQYKDEIELDVEYMDTKNFNDKKHYENLYALYKNKASRKHYDVISATDNSAFLFLLQYRDDLYPNVPVVFCGVDRFHGLMLENRPSAISIDSILAGHDLVTGVMEAFDYESTIETALKFHPSAKRVILVNSDPNEATYWPTISKKDIDDLVQKFGGRVKFVNFFLSEENVGEFLRLIEGLGNESIVYLTSDFKDLMGRLYPIEYGGVMILEQCVAPVYIVWREWFGHGPVVGGNLVSGFNQGRKAAEMVMRIMDGESVRNIPIIRESPNQFMFDYVQLKHFGISLSELPEGSVIFNQPKSLYYQYKKWFLAVAAVIIILAAMVILLSVNILRRKRAEEALRIRNVAVESSINAIALRDMEGNISYVNNSFLKLLGYSDEKEVLGKPVEQFWMDVDKVAQVRRIVLDKGSWVGELVARRKDGSTFDAQLSINLVKDENGKSICIMASFIEITERKRAEIAMAHSEAIYRKAIENARGVPYQLRVADGKYVFMGSGVEELVGIPAEKLTRQMFHELIQEVNPVGTSTSEDIAEYGKKRPVDKIKRGQADIRIRTPNGEVKWLNDSFLPFRDEKTGEITGAIGILQDITDRKRAEDVLRESEARYKALFQTAAEGILVADIETRKFRYVNPAICRMLDYTEEELKRLSVGDIHPKADLKHVISEFEAQVRGEKILAPNIPCLRKDGTIIYADINAANVLIDGRGCNVGFFTDITERKHAEEKLEEIQRQQKAMLDNIPDIAWLKDKDSVYIAVNEPFAEACGIRAEDLAGKRDLDIWPEDLAGRYIADDKEVIKSGKRRRIEELLENRAGERITVETIKTPIYDDKGDVIGTIGIAHDITDRKRAAEELQKARDELEIRVQERTDDLAKTNIELRNEIIERRKVEEKLLVYQKQLRSLASELSLAEERLRRRIATDVHDNIGQNLAISKIKIESLRGSVSSPELAGTLDEIRDLIAQTIKSMRSLTFELSPPVLYELGFEAAVEWLVRQAEQQHGLTAEFQNDKKRKPLSDNVRVFLFQAVRELLVNVAKHAHAHNVRVSTRRVGNKIRVSVEDDGVGFDVSQIRSQDYRTGGLGLFNIRERLGYIGGGIDINSKPGGGTQITLVAPIDHRNGNSKEKQK